MDAIAPPYTPEFVQLVLPMVENEEITGTMRAEGENDPVSEFIGQSHNHYNNFVLCILYVCYFFTLKYSTISTTGIRAQSQNLALGVFYATLVKAAGDLVGPNNVT